MYLFNLTNTSLLLSDVSVGVHYYWNIGGFTVHGQVFIIIWLVVFFLLALALIGTSKIEQQEPGNMKFSIYQKTLDDMGVEIFMGDYIGYYESEDRVRYYAVSDDGYVKSDNKHTYGGYKPFYRTVVATYVSENEFRGI